VSCGVYWCYRVGFTSISPRTNDNTLVFFQACWSNVRILFSSGRGRTSRVGRLLPSLFTYLHGGADLGEHGPRQCISLLPSPPLLVYSDVGGDVGRLCARYPAVVVSRYTYRACVHDSCCYRILAVVTVSFVSFAIIRSITSDLTHR